MNGSLKTRTIRGLVWSFLSQGGKQFSQFVITTILARLLSPDDFGLLGMATVFIGLATLFNDLGVSGALIQKGDVEERHLSSAFWLNVATGIVLMLVLAGSSPLVAAFYSRPRLQNILIVLSLHYPIASLGIIQQTLLTKTMDFKKLAIRDLLAVILSGLAGIFFALSGYGVWSLVLQFLIWSMVQSFLPWILSPWRPRFIFSLSALKEIFPFSVRLMGSNLVIYLAQNVDYLLVGKFLGSEPLGYYTLAFKLMRYPIQNICQIVNKVMFPALSIIQKDVEKVRSIYLKLVRSVSLLTFPFLFGLFAVAPEFIRVVFGPKWEPAIILLRILIASGIFQSLVTFNGTIYLSQGRADIQLKMQVLGAVIVAAAVAAGLTWGVIGVASCYTVQSVLLLQVSLYVARRIIQLGSKEFYSQMIKPVIISLTILMALFIAKTILFLPAAFKLGVLGLLAVLLYGLLLMAIKEVTVNKNGIHLAALD
jgi:PST family polysaccharide transporter